MKKSVSSFSYKGAQSRVISFPLGGIGSGCIGLNGSGHLVDWEIFNRPAKGSLNGFSHFAIKAEARGKVLDARLLHGDVSPPFIGEGTRRYGGFGFGVARETLSGLPHFRQTEFKAGFPIAEIQFRDEHFPGLVTLTAFNPFIPLNDRDSSLPAAFFAIEVVNPTARAIDYTLAFTLQNPAHGKTVNRGLKTDRGRILHMTGEAGPEDVNFMDFAIATEGGDTSVQEYWYRGPWFDNLGVFWQNFTTPGGLPLRSYPEPGKLDHGTVSVRLRAAAGGRVRARFIFTWNVPNCYNYWKEKSPCAGGDCCTQPATWKNYYATLFPDSTASAQYGLANWDRLENETRLFRDTLFASTLPPAVLDAVSANISILKTPTCLRLADGSFYGFEGCHSDCGCCEGSCTHVWNYAYALPFLFPALERSMRELDYRYNLRPDGGMPFRLQLPIGSDRSGFRPCADGQFGGVLKMYREWKISGDTDWLRRWWPAVRQSIEFAWAPTNEDRWDPGKTGVLQGRQHHTLDMELFGPNAWLTGFYLAAFKAGAEMAEVCGEPEVAAEYRAIFKRGRDWTNRHLFNGEFFVQRLDLEDRKVLEPFEQDAAKYWSEEHGELKYQLGDGCGIDQVLAQWHADLIGLGDIFDRKKTLRALQAIYRHNYKPSLRDVFNPCRLYGLDDEAGTMMFAWPKGRRRPVIPVPYAEETMHGFEYQAASHLIWNGLIEEGVKMVQAVRNRYDGERRNPWNEIECGSNYARSMASYALLNAFSGFSFDTPAQCLGFRPAPVAGGRFQCFWSLGTAWGEVEIQPRRAMLRVRYGTLAIRRLNLDVGGAEGVRADLDGKIVDCRKINNGYDFGQAVQIRAGSELRLQAQAARPVKPNPARKTKRS